MDHKLKQRQPEDFIKLRDLHHLCLSKWYWFVISLFLFIGIAVIYILITPPVYTRSASIVIKDESNGKSLSGDLSNTFSDMGLFQAMTNVNNELLSFQSPAILLDVVKRLHLDIDCMVEGHFKRKLLYGKELPYIIHFIDLKDNESATFTVDSHKDGRLELYNFTRDGIKIKMTEVIKGIPNDTIMTPVGRLLIASNTSYVGAFTLPIYVTRTNVFESIDKYALRLTAILEGEKSTVISLSFSDICIQRAEDVLHTLISVYNENLIKEKKQIAISTSMFVNERLRVIEAELGNVDEDISSYKSSNLLTDVQAASGIYLTRSNETSSRILALNTQLSLAKYIQDYLTSSSSRNQLLPSNSGIENPSIESQIYEYNAKQLQRNNLEVNSSEKNPLVNDLDQSLDALRKAIVSSINNLMFTLKTQIDDLQKSEQQTTAHIADTPTQAKYLLSVERQQKVKEALYLFLLQKREENELSQAFTAYNTRIIAPPHGKMTPTSPKKNNILLAAFVLGLLIPFVIIFIREYFNTTVRRQKDLEGLPIPFLGEIPLTYREKWKFRKKPFDTLSFVVKKDTQDRANEAFRMLRLNLEGMVGKDAQSNVILLTSFNFGSGKSFLTINIAASLALKGKKVLVIDGDLRHNSISLFAGTSHKGLSDYLAKQEHNLENMIIKDETYANLHILPAGTITSNPTELLEEERLEIAINDLRGKYDFILIDSPPVGVVADTSILEKMADKTIFVLRAGLQERSGLDKLEYIYHKQKFKNMAMILNATASDARHYRPDYLNYFVKQAQS